ncbi:hypothetical protein G9A89_001433 [Geosiphon pyriformis]|nr:hypothetical protein G9A89_001433 [Geosiphon pyriformis]
MSKRNNLWHISINSWPTTEKKLEKKLVQDPILLNQFAKYAVYANHAYCNTSGNAENFKGTYGNAQLIENEVIVYLRGDEYLFTLMKEQRFSTIHYPEKVKGSMVIESFYNSFRKVRGQVFALISVLLKNSKCNNLRVVGHGLGGAYAIFVALEQRKLYPKLDIKIYSYGQPRVGNDQFVFHVNRLFPIQIFRITLFYDWISQIPRRILETKFAHYGTEYFIWYNLKCECVDPYKNVDPTVFECNYGMAKHLDYNESKYREPRDCNALYATWIRGNGISSHWGPFFKQFMGDCPERRNPPIFKIESQ